MSLSGCDILATKIEDGIKTILQHQKTYFLILFYYGLMIVLHFYFRPIICKKNFKFIFYVSKYKLAF